jgi:hypothetical protein
MKTPPTNPPLNTHLGMTADQIGAITYDYDGPAGCQRKLVRTTQGTFIYRQIGNAWRIAENRPLYTREQAQALYRRVKQWADRAHQRLRTTILVPVFGGDGCVLHNSMLAWEEGQPWKCLLSRHPNYYHLGRRYQHEENRIYRTADRLTSHLARYF